MTEPSGDDRLLDHEYDGIREYDNPLPRWWVWIFYACILFVPWYYLNPAGLGSGPPRLAAYAADSAAAAAADAKRMAAVTAAGSEVTDAALARLRTEPQVLALGKKTFLTNCSPCHRPDAGGLIGPNLTDDYWLHGGSLMEIHTTVTTGVLDKGMPPWGRILQPDQLNAVVAYVSTLRGTHPPNPKPPQGVKAASP